MASQALTTRSRALIGSGLVLVAGGLLLGFRDLTRVGLLLLALPLLAWLLVGTRRIDVDVDRSVDPPVIESGRRTTVRLRLTAPGHGRVPLLVGQEQVPQACGRRPRVVIPSLRPGEQVQVTYQLAPAARGRHQLGPLALTAYDPFELVWRRRRAPGSAQLLVLPRVHPLRGLPSAAGGHGTEGRIPHQVALHGEDDVSLRDYRHGDDLRRVHWLATARTGELMVRTEDRPSQRRAVLLVDARQEAHTLDADGTLEWVCAAAASVGAHLDQHRYAVHLLTPGTCAEGRVAAAETGAMLEELALVEPAPDALEGVLHAAVPLVTAGGLVVAVVAPLDPDRARRLAMLRQPSCTGVALVVTEPQEDERAQETAQLLRGHGWAVAAVDVRTGVADAWAGLSAAGGGRP